jgi:hypothetical protein
VSDEKSLQEKLEKTRESVLIEEAHESRRSSNDMARWTVASLLLANGGAVVALLGSEYTREALFANAGWFFLGGFLATLVAGFAHSLYAESYASALLESIWNREAADHPDYQKLCDGAANKAIGSALIWLGLMAVAFVAFVLGCVSVSNQPKRGSPTGPEMLQKESHK